MNPQDQEDLQVFEKAYEEYEKNPATYSLDEVERDLSVNE